MDDLVEADLRSVLFDTHSTISNRGSWMWARFSVLPVHKLSTIKISSTSSRSNSRSTKSDPRKPHPPDTKTFFTVHPF